MYLLHTLHFSLSIIDSVAFIIVLLNIYYIILSFLLDIYFPRNIFLLYIYYILFTELRT
jgi:hypothetical protein